MQESIAQCDFYRQKYMHYMVQQSIENFTWEEFEYNQHVELQDPKWHPIAFLAEMMGDIMHKHQAIRQPNAAEFFKAVIKKSMLV